MDATQQERISRFMKDEGTSNAVYGLLLSVFLEGTKTTDVNTLAAERIAINLLQESWKKLERLRTKEKQETQNNRQIGI